MPIRLARADDAGTIADILSRAFLETFRTDGNEKSVRAYLDGINPKTIRTLLEVQAIRFLVYEDEKISRIIGFLQLVSSKESPKIQEVIPNSSVVSMMIEKPCLKLEKVFVDPDFQGRGTGRQLVERSVEVGRMEGFATLWLMVLRSNTRAVALYEKLGFEVFATCPGKFQEDDDIDLCMCLPLNKTREESK